MKFFGFGASLKFITAAWLIDSFNEQLITNADKLAIVNLTMGNYPAGLLLQELVH